MNHMRHASFDTLKGILIMIVAAGHLLLGSLDQNPARRLIYFFHMPLFIGVTGYFVKEDLLLRRPQVILKKYFNRLIVPYLPAFLVYSSMVWLHAHRTGDLAPKTFVTTITHPYYHLWYIPAVILFVFYTKWMATMMGKTAVWIGVGIAFWVTVLAGIYGDANEAVALFEAIGDSRFYSYYYYFLIGYLASRYHLGKVVVQHRLHWMLMLFLLLMVYQVEYIQPLSTVLINTVLIILAISACEKNKAFNIGGLSAIGKVSLPIYLWHVLPLVILKKLFPDGGLPYYALAGSSLFFLICALVAFEDKAVLINRFLYGTPLRRGEATC